MTPVEIHTKLQMERRRSNKHVPNLTTVRRAIKGSTFKRSRKETRGRPRRLTKANVSALDRTRKKLIGKAAGEHEVHWGDIIKAARVPDVERTTAAKNMKEAGFDIQWRTPRLKPMRGEADEVDRKRVCDKLRKLPLRFWVDDVDAYIDCKDWPIPRSARGKKYLNMARVRGHLRTKGEGLGAGFTKPDKKKHRVNTGGNAKLCAAIIGSRVRVWHYLQKGWGGQAAKDMYEKVLAPALQRHRGEKRKYILLEDNDPSGFKSKVAMDAKKGLKIHPIEFPTYSPDLNPLDFSLWQEVEDRMSRQKTPSKESADAFKARLRKTAMTIPPPVIRKMVASIKPRAQSIYDHNGGHIPRD
jgi:hypothetical protein